MTNDRNNVVAFRPYKFPRRKLVDSDFIPSSYEQNTEFMFEDLAASGLTPDDLQASVEGKYILPAGFVGAYTIPYTDPDGSFMLQDSLELKMYRLKLKKAPEAPTRRKYDQPNKDELAEFGLPGIMPYIPPMYHEREKSPVLLICEGEKKTVAAIKHLETSAIGLGGCWGWRDGGPDGDCHPWIPELARRHERVLIVPDGDFRRYDIAKAYGTLCSELRRVLGEDYQIGILECPGKLDDLIVQWGPEAADHFWQLPTCDPEGLVEDPATLAKKFDLAFRVDQKGIVRIYENTYNVTKLIERHLAFPEIWHDVDRNKIMMGEEMVVPGQTEMEVANHFQYNFQMPTVKARDVDAVLKALALKNARSPFYEWVRNLAWDGVPRLETWMIRHWQMEDTPYIREVSSKFLVASVHRMMDPGCKVDWMLITSGKQGTGKSSMPDIIFRGNAINILGSHTDKDVQLMMHSGLCVVLDELDALNAKEADFWKSAITTREDRFRPPYGRDVHYFKRRSILYGTTNTVSFLANDPSGFRRYKPVTATALLDFAGLAAEIPMLWAEAHHLAKMGTSPDVINMPDNMNDHVSLDPVEEAILGWLQGVARHPQANERFYGKVYGKEVFEFRMMDVCDGANIANATQKKVQSRVDSLLRNFGVEKRDIGMVFKQKCFRVSDGALEKLREV